MENDLQLLHTDVLVQGKKPLPFPLETMQDEVLNTYLELDKIRKRVEVARRSNLVNDTPAREKTMKNLQYKINTCMSILRKFSMEVDTLGF